MTVSVTGTASDESGGSGIQKVEVKVGSNPFKLATATGPEEAETGLHGQLLMLLQPQEALLSSHVQQIMQAIQKIVTITCNCDLHWCRRRHIYLNIFSAW